MKGGRDGTVGALLQTEIPHFVLQKMTFGTRRCSASLGLFVHIFCSRWLIRYTRHYKSYRQRDVITGSIVQYDATSGYHQTLREPNSFTLFL